MALAVVVDCRSRTLAWSSGASSHLISSFVGGNAPSHTIIPRCSRVHKSRYTAPASLDSQDRHKAAAQQRAGALQSHHLGCNCTPVAPGRTPSGAPSHGEAVDGTAEAPDQQVARRTRSRTDTSHNNRLQNVVHTPQQHRQWSRVPHPTFLASDSGATTDALSEQSAKRKAWTMVGDECSPTLQDCLQEDDVCKVVLS